MVPTVAGTAHMHGIFRPALCLARPASFAVAAGLPGPRYRTPSSTGRRCSTLQRGTHATERLVSRWRAPKLLVVCLPTAARGPSRNHPMSARRGAARVPVRMDASQSDAPANPIWNDVVDAYARAKKLDAAYSIDTKPELIQDPATQVQFVVRIATALKDKPKAPPKVPAASEAAAPKKPWRNPFLPYEEELHVRALPPHHELLLNKFNVVDHHLLVVTKAFEQQTDPINERDFAAVWDVLGAFPEPGGLAFYNCGDASGHSQPHKHIQVVPLPFDTRLVDATPFESKILDAAAEVGGEGIWMAEYGQVFSVAALPFKNFCCLLNPVASTPADLEAWYTVLLKETHLSSQSWNLVMTKTWMMMVPRSAERIDDVSLNALGYAGTLLVRSTTELQQVREMGPMNILAAAGYAP